MSSINTITKDLDKFRDRQVICMVLLWVLSASAVICTYNKEKEYALLSAVFASTSAFGVTYFANKTNGVTRTLIHETLGMLTGGDNFCYVQLQRLSGGMANVMLLHKSDENGKAYPLYNVNIQLAEVSSMLSEKSVAEYGPITKEEALKESQDFLKDRASFTIQEVTPGFVHTLGKIKIPNPKDCAYNIFFSARNKRWHQEYRAHITADGTLSATILVLDSEKKGVVLYEAEQKYRLNPWQLI